MKFELPIKGKRLWLLILGGVGVLLLLFGSFIPNERSETIYTDFPYKEYELALEKKLEEFCSFINGIENVKAFVTLETSVETVYAQNSTVSTSQSTYEYLLFGTESPLPIYEVTPKIRGIAIACDGGNEAYIQKILTELISSATGVPSNKIKIVGYG
ncbi:MAG: hypothetical protein J6D21_05625 [Clostridia bacterium]|nr:hypothetical protein [Clostridia bacterium]